MSDNLYRRDLSDGQEFDLWRMSGKSEQNLSRTERRKVDFDVTQRIGDSATSSSRDTNVINRSVNNELVKDVSEPDLKIAVVVLDSVNALTQHLLSHPFVVIRRQTQVNSRNGSYHLIPFSVMAFIVRIQSKQGFGVLWKGIVSVFMTKAIQIGIESIVAELTPFVRDLGSRRITLETVVQHLILKGVAIVVVTPFLCSSCSETVQSSIASENPGVLDSISEGFSRITEWKMGRKLPIWLLCGPTLAYHLSHYLISSSVQKLLFYVTTDYKESETENVNKYRNKYKDIMSCFWGQLFADVLLFPLQTVIMRLYLQGTRTIVDNVQQSGAEVIPIISDYDSTNDCFSTIVREEGRLGLFKGFGALVLQYSIHYSLLRLTKYCLKKTISGL